MDYRLIERTGWQVSTLSFGCMRFADEASADAAIKQAFALGVNYFDVAPGYGSGTAEPWLGTGLKGLPRDQVIVTAKSSPGNGGTGVGEYSPHTGFGIRSAAEARTQIERSMQIIGVDHLDMYHLWACHGDPVFEEAIKPGGFLEGVTAAREEGLLDYIGLTTHMDGPGIIRYLQRFEFDTITIPYQLRDTTRADAVAYCAERGIGVIGMNPLAGGALVKSVPVLQRIALELGLSSMAEAALRYLIGLPGVTTALGGITYDHQAVENAAAVSTGALPPEVVAALHDRVHELYATVEHFCSACGYCGECPQGLAIPALLEVYSNTLVPSVAEDALLTLAARLAEHPEQFDPALCTACGQCESKCPNKLPVSELMAKAAALAEAIDRGH